MLIVLAIFVGCTVELELPEREPNCVTVMEYEYQGRDDEGRPRFDYTEKEKCYER